MMTIPTEDRTAINARLAAAMGYTQDGAYWFAPNGTAALYPPDFFTNAAASRMLVEWLATQEREVQNHFIHILSRALLKLHGDDGVSVLDWMAAPLDAIARAADAAITTQLPLRSSNK